MQFAVDFAVRYFAEISALFPGLDQSQQVKLVSTNEYVSTTVTLH